MRRAWRRCIRFVRRFIRHIKKTKFHFRIRVKFTNKKLRKCVRKSVRRMILIVRRRTFKIKKCVFRYIFKFHISRSKKIYIMRRVRKILRKYKKIIKRAVRKIIRAG